MKQQTTFVFPLFQCNVHTVLMQELLDIVSLFNIGIVKSFIDINNPKVESFIHQMLHLVLSQIKNQKHRNISYLTKAIRCAEAFQNPLYSQFFQLLGDNQVSQMQPFDFIALLNCAIRGKSESSISVEQISFIQKSLERVLQKGWIESASIHGFLDIVNSVRQMDELFSASKQITTLLNIAKDQINNKLLKQYKQMTGQQIIRVIKFLIKDKRKFEGSHKIISSVFQSIHEDGSSSIDPIFAIRLILFIKTESLDEIDPKWEDKLMKVIEFYFVKNKVLSRPIYDGLQLIAEHGSLSETNLFKLLDYLKQMMKEIDKTDEMKNKITKNITILQIMHKLFMYEQSQATFKKVIHIKQQNNAYNFLFFHYYLAFNSYFLKQLNYNDLFQMFQQVCVSNEKKSLFGTKNNNNISVSKQLTFDELLKLLIEKQRNNKKQGTQWPKSLNIFLDKTITSLRFHLNYKQINCLLQSVSLTKFQTEMVLINFLKLSIPIACQEQVIKYFEKSQLFYSSQSCAYFCFCILRESKNIDMKNSTNQAKLFIKVCQNVPLETKLKYYSDNQVLNFLTIFTPQLLYDELNQIIHKLQLTPQTYEFTFIRMLSILTSKSNDIKIIQTLHQRLITTKFSNKNMLDLFAHICLQNSLSTKEQIETIQNVKLSKQILQYPKPEYKKFMEKILQFDKPNKKNLQIIHQFSTSFKDTFLEDSSVVYELTKDLMKVIKFLSGRKQMSEQEVKDLFQPLFRDVVLKIKYQTFWVFHALNFAEQMNWIIPQIFDRAVQVASNELFWKSNYRSEDIIHILILYPSHNKQSSQFLRVLVRTLEYCPQKIDLVYKHVSQIDDMKNCPQNIERYIEYLKGKSEERSVENKR